VLRGDFHSPRRAGKIADCVECARGFGADDPGENGVSALDAGAFGDGTQFVHDRIIGDPGRQCIEELVLAFVVRDCRADFVEVGVYHKVVQVRAFIMFQPASAGL
jgi:hypothetical protein